MGNLFELSKLELTNRLGSADTFDAWWGGSGSVKVTRVNSDTIDIALKFRAREEGTIFEFEGDASAHVNGQVCMQLQSD